MFRSSAQPIPALTRRSSSQQPSTTPSLPSSSLSSHLGKSRTGVASTIDAPHHHRERRGSGLHNSTINNTNSVPSSIGSSSGSVSAPAGAGVRLGLPKLQPHAVDGSGTTPTSICGSVASTNGMSRSSFAETPSRSSHSPHMRPSPHAVPSVPAQPLPSLPRIDSNGSFSTKSSLAVASPAMGAGGDRAPPLRRRGFLLLDTRTNRAFEGAPAKWRGAGRPNPNPPPKSVEARAMTQSYQQFISLKILLSESRRYAWENIVLRHPEASGDEVLVYQFNSTWGQLVDDVTTAIVERQVPNVGGASSIVNMMELFQRHSPAVDLLPDCTPPIGPRHLPIDWYEAQRADVRAAVVEERQARKGRAVMRAMSAPAVGSASRSQAKGVQQRPKLMAGRGANDGR